MINEVLGRNVYSDNRSVGAAQSDGDLFNSDPNFRLQVDKAIARIEAELTYIKPAKICGDIGTIYYELQNIEAHCEILRNKIRKLDTSRRFY